MKNFGCVVVLILVLATLLVLLVPLLPANAAGGGPKKTPIPHHNKDDKTVPANCHSRHAREAGISCGDDTDNGTPKDKPGTNTGDAVPNSNKKQLPTAMPVPGSDPPVYLPLVLRDNSSGSHTPYPYPAP